MTDIKICSHYLEPVPGTFALPECAGTREIYKDGKEAFDHVDGGFSKFMSKKPGKYTPAIELQFFDVMFTATPRTMFRCRGKLSDRVFTQDQIITSGELYRKELSVPGRSTLFLFKHRGEYCFASASGATGGVMGFGSGFFRIHASSLAKKKDPWHIDRRNGHEVRIAVPILMTPESVG